MNAKPVLEFIKESLRRFDENKGSAFAAALAYYVLVSSVPVIILAISAAGIFLGSSEVAARAILNLIHSNLPQMSEQIANVLEKLVSAQGVTGGVGIAGLFWSGSRLFLTLEQALTVTWECEERKWWKSYLMSFAITLSVGLLPLSSVVVSLGNDLFRTFGQYWLEERFEYFEFLFRIASLAVAPVLSGLSFMFLFKLLPNCRVPWRSAALGALISAVLFEIAKNVFSFYVAKFASYDKLYGSIAGAITIVFWIQFAATVILLGGEFAATSSRRLKSRII